MGPGVWFRRRSRVPSAIVAVVASIASLTLAASAQATASVGEQRRIARWDRTAGEAGSGTPALPIVYPTSARRAMSATAVPQIRFSDLHGVGWVGEGRHPVRRRDQRLDA